VAALGLDEAGTAVVQDAISQGIAAAETERLAKTDRACRLIALAEAQSDPEAYVAGLEAADVAAKTAAAVDAITQA
jgi:hypothetical protein